MGLIWLRLFIRYLDLSGGWLGAELRMDPKDWRMCSKLVYHSKLSSQLNWVGTYVAFLHGSVSADFDN